jgi:hypothetical protein
MERVARDKRLLDPFLNKLTKYDIWSLRLGRGSALTFKRIG